MLEDRPAVAVEMLIEGDPVAGVSEQIGEHGLAALDRLPPEVFAVKFDQIERAEDGGVVVMPITDQIEDREPVRVDDDGNSPSTTHERTDKPATAAAIFGERVVKSYPFRENSRTRSPSRRATIRKPSCLISCTQPMPEGGAMAVRGRQGWNGMAP